MQEDHAALKPAMLSVHYHARGDRLETRGSPAVLLRPGVEPMPLDEALDRIFDDGDLVRVREAVWALIRSVPAPRHADDSEPEAVEERYGPELRDCIAERNLFDLAAFDRRRFDCRKGARLFAAALVAYPADLQPSLEMYDHTRTQSSAFETAMVNTNVLGPDVTPAEFLRRINERKSKELEVVKGRRRPARHSREEVASSLERLEEQVGVSIDAYIGAFADTVAFMDMCKDIGLWDADQDVTVFPSFTVATQDARTLTTTVTATALVRPVDFECITRAIDPRRWREMSDQFQHVAFISDAYTLAEENIEADIGAGLPPRAAPYLVEERVSVISDIVGAEVGQFHNVLKVDAFTVERGETDDDHRADLDFCLYRSIDSRVLWDSRPGGLLVDSGWTKIRCISDTTWRLTSCKILRFADRTPNTGWDGPADFGQMLNYLAPAAITAWLENDLYSGQQQTVHGEATMEGR